MKSSLRRRVASGKSAILIKISRVAGDGSDEDNDEGFLGMARRNDQVEGGQSNSVDDGSFNNQAGAEGGGVADGHESSSGRDLGEFQGFRKDVCWLFLN